MDNAQHLALLDTLVGAKSMVMLCGYSNPLYDAKLKGWQKIVIPTMAFSKSKNACHVDECLWINPTATTRKL